MRSDNNNHPRLPADCDDRFARAIVTVVSTEGSIALVEASGTAGCGSCSQSKGCGTRTLMAFFGKKEVHLRVANTLGAMPGDRIEIQIEQSTILKLSAISYLLPLLGLVGGGAIGSAFHLGDGVALAGAIVGLLAGFGYGHHLYRSDRWERAIAPSCIRRVSSRGENYIDVEAIQ